MLPDSDFWAQERTLEAPRLSSIAGVARALIATVGVDDAVGILSSQFGWDVAFSALARLDCPEASVALWRSVELLVCDEIDPEDVSINGS